MTTPNRKTDLLDAAIEHVSEHGLTDLSLRGLAAELGTSHRMLSHHFGSKNGLWTAMVKEVERRQIATMGEPPDPSLTLGEVLRSHWRAISDPALWPSERLFFEVYSRALSGAPGTEGFLDDIVESWIAPAVEMAPTLGIPGEHARPLARLGVAVTRGLLLDLLATGDRAGVDAAMDVWIESVSSLLE